MSAWAVALAVLLTSGCAAGIKVQTDYDHDADFAGLHTFAWLPRVNQSGDPRADSSLLAGRVRRAAVAELEGKGYREVSSDAKPDFYVAYQAAIDEKLSVQSTPTYYAYRGWWGPVPVASPPTVHQYEVGTLVLDIVDRERDDLIWRGSGQAKLRRNDDRSPAERDEAVAKAVAAILEDFPPTAGR